MAQAEKYTFEDIGSWSYVESVNKFSKRHTAYLSATIRNTQSPFARALAVTIVFECRSILVDRLMVVHWGADIGEDHRPLLQLWIDGREMPSSRSLNLDDGVMIVSGGYYQLQSIALAEEVTAKTTTHRGDPVIAVFTIEDGAAALTRFTDKCRSLGYSSPDW